MKKYFVLKDGVKYNGKEYKRGEELDHKLGIRDQRILNNMVKMRKIGLVQPETHVSKTKTEPAPQVAAAVPPPAPAPVASSEPEIVHKGGGYYEVVKNGIVISDGVTLKGEEAAKKFVDEL